MIVDFTALMEQSDPWPKTNHFGHPHYRKKTANNAWNPYMEFAEGSNTFRVLSAAIVGYEWWVATTDNGRRPVRVRTASEVPDEVRSATDIQDRPKHFWAFTVYNYQAQAIQVLEIKQQTIMRAIESLVKNPKWGSPRKYDLTVEKVKTGSRDLDVEYHVFPEPKLGLDEGIAALANNVPVRLEALYDGDDPFALSPDTDEGAVNGDAALSKARALRRA